MDYEEKYKKAMLHIQVLNLALDNERDKSKFYQNEVEILKERLKCIV